MIPVKCPRCLQEWYSDEEDAGRVRLCSACADDLRRNRRGSPVRLDAFMVAAAFSLAATVALILLGRLWPETFGMVLLVVGLLLFVGGLSGFRLVAGRQHIGDVDWVVARWPMMVALMGLACVLAYFPLARR